MGLFRLDYGWHKERRVLGDYPEHVLEVDRIRREQLSVRSFAAPDLAKPLNDAHLCGSFYTIGLPQGWMQEPLWQ